MKSEVFKTELQYIKNERIKESLINMINLLPDYFFEVAASSTGKYHPEFSLGEGGLIRHTKVAVRIAHELLENESLTNFTSDEKDLIVFALTLHDGLKSGLIKSEYTKIDHPLIMSKFLKDNKNNTNLKEDEIQLVCNMIEKHMGPWTTDYKGNEILEAPKSKYERFVHMCDYLASRKFLNVNFESNEIVDEKKQVYN